MICLRKIIGGGLALLCVTIGGSLISGAPAFAGYVYGPETPIQFGGPGVGNGQFADPTGVAASQATGDVYVVDKGNNRVQRFDASGDYLSQFNGSDDPSFPAGFSAPTSIAVDNSTSSTDASAGDVYVIDFGDNTIDKFDAAGTYLSSLTPPPQVGEFPAGFAAGELEGIAIDQSGDVWVYNGRSVDEYANGGDNAFKTGWETHYFSVAEGFAVDSASRVYLVHGFSKLVQRFSALGINEEQIGGECEECTTALAINQTGSDLFVERPTDVSVFNSSGVEIDEPFGTDQLTSTGGIAVNSTVGTPSGGDVYVADAAANEIDVYAPIKILPEAMTGVPLESQPTSATVSGTVDPYGGTSATCQIEYGSATVYEMSVPCSPSGPFSGASVIPVTGTLTDLTAGLTYYYRIASTSSAGTSYGEDQHFRLTPPPLVDEQPGYATNVTQFSATLNGSIEPYNSPTSYHFVYGTTTAYGSVVPVPDIYTPVNDNDEAVVPTTIGSLQPGTTYHFALVVTAPGGDVTSPDETFTTATIPLPEAVTGGASGASEGAITLSGAVNPEGWDTTYQFQYGTTTAYGSSWPSVSVQAGQFTGLQDITIYLQNLQPTTTYHYRLIATNPAGTVYGADQSFTTTSYPFSAIQETPVLGAPAGVPSRKSTPKALTSAQKLANALKACKLQPKKKRAACVIRARRKYTPAERKKK